MSATVKELRDWLNTLDHDDVIGIDDGGLTIQVVDYDDMPAHFELGGVPDLPPTDDDFDENADDDLQRDDLPNADGADRPRDVEPPDDEARAAADSDAIAERYDAGHATRAELLAAERRLYRAIERKHAEPKQ